MLALSYFVTLNLSEAEFAVVETILLACSFLLLSLVHFITKSLIAKHGLEIESNLTPREAFRKGTAGRDLVFRIATLSIMSYILIQIAIAANHWLFLSIGILIASVIDFQNDFRIWCRKR